MNETNHACVHCGICTKNCRFLQKYGIDIGDTERLNELAYHCFLCGKCTEVCPKGIDGRVLILRMRQRQAAENGGRVPQKGYGMLLKEKRKYLFENYRNASGKSVLFPGCNFPSFYPKSMKYLAELLKERAGIGVIYDCCGKPVAELGLEQAEAEIIAKLNRKLRERDIEEIIMLCPNCYYFLKPRLEVKVVSIYEKMRELGIGQRIAGDVRVFLPCPDRGAREILRQIEPFVDGEMKLVMENQCCGLGGCAGVREPELAGQLAREGEGELCTYCASCAGNFVRNGHTETTHLLVELLGTGERPDTGKSLLNRARTRFL